MDTETPNATMEDRRLYLRAFRAAIRYRDQQTGRRHFCHLMPYRPHFLRRVLELRRVLREPPNDRGNLAPTAPQEQR